MIVFEFYIDTNVTVEPYPYLFFKPIKNYPLVGYEAGRITSIYFYPNLEYRSGLTNRNKIRTCLSQHTRDGIITSSIQHTSYINYPVT